MAQDTKQRCDTRMLNDEMIMKATSELLHLGSFMELSSQEWGSFFKGGHTRRAHLSLIQES